METPNSKAELLQEMNTHRSSWDDLLTRIPESAMRETGVEGIWSVKEIVAHICAYEQYMAAMLQDMKENNGNATAMLDSYYQIQLTVYRAGHPEIPEQLQELKGDQVNEVFTAAYRFKRASEVVKMEAEAYQKIVQWIAEFSDEELAHPFANTNRTLLQVVPRQCYIHYQYHIPAIQSWWDNKPA